MPETASFGSFLNDNKKLAKEYIDTKLAIYKLQLIRSFSKSAGYLVWMIVSFFLFWLLIIFGGLVTGFWLSELTGSYTKGFGITTLLIVALIILIALLRKTIFINPIIRTLIHKAAEDKEEG